jgi:hypothetical protein
MAVSAPLRMPDKSPASVTGSVRPPIPALFEVLPACLQTARRATDPDRCGQPSAYRPRADARLISSAEATLSRSSSKGSAYVSSVIAALACPSIRCTALTFAPALIASEAAGPEIVRRHSRHDRTKRLFTHARLNGLRCVFPPSAFARPGEPPRLRVARPQVAIGLGREDQFIRPLEHDRVSHRRIGKSRSSPVEWCNRFVILQGCGG